MNLILPLRIVQALLALIVLGLAGYCVDALDYYPQAAFLVFTSVWTFVVLAYLLVTPMYFPDMHNRWVVVGSEGVTMIFWFAGFIAIADTTRPTRFKCFGYGCRVLGCAQAAAVMGAFAWIAWSVTLGLIIHALIQYRKGGSAVDPDAGNATAPTTTANPAALSGAEKIKMRVKDKMGMSKSKNKKEKDGVDGEDGDEGFMGILSAPLGGHDIEMFGGGQKPQPERLELNLPDPVHHASGPHVPQPQQQSQSQPQLQDPFRLPSHSDAPVAPPNPADFGGRL